ncbi:NAD-dependent epimerase/dehydratase family protein [Thermodesulfobacteriota bacterium]
MSIKGKRIFITGGGGFIGSALCRKLVEDNELVIYDNQRRDSIRFTDLAGHNNLAFRKGDIRDIDELRKHIRDVDMVVHLAAMAGVSSYFQFPVETMEINMIGTYNVVKVSHEVGVERFVNFSSSEVYGPSIFGAREEQITSQGNIHQARWSYSVSKLAGEHLCFAYRQQQDLPVVSLRPFNIYGPGQVGEGAIQIFVPKALRNEAIHVTGDGNQIRSWCYIDDFIDGAVAAMSCPDAVGEVFNIGNPRGTITILNLVEKIVTLTGSRSKIVFMPHPSTEIELRVPNIELAERVLGFSPKIDLDEGLTRSIEWYRDIYSE